MPVFISYSHQDKLFVDKLAKQLVQHHVNIWLDRWELSIGDSIVEKVQDAIDGSSALLVVLSKNSTKSEWCKREINSGLIKELLEKRVFVLPVLIEECTIPLFARDKLYADFRKSFDDGIQVVLEGIAKITNPNLAQFNEPDYITDHAIDWITNKHAIILRLTYIDYAKNGNYSCLTTIAISPTLETMRKINLLKFVGKDEGGHSRYLIIKSFNEYLKRSGGMRIQLSDQFEKIKQLEFPGPNGDPFVATIGARRLGEDTGRDTLITISNNIEMTYRHQKEVLRIKDD